MAMKTRLGHLISRKNAIINFMYYVDGCYIRKYPLPLLAVV